jgi:hypothetical protein
MSGRLLNGDYVCVCSSRVAVQKQGLPTASVHCANVPYYCVWYKCQARGNLTIHLPGRLAAGARALTWRVNTAGKHTTAFWAQKVTSCLRQTQPGALEPTIVHSDCPWCLLASPCILSVYSLSTNAAHHERVMLGGLSWSFALLLTNAQMSLQRRPSR